jgi:transposase
MDLPHSDGCLEQAYPAETTEAFCAGHDASFEFFGGVPRSILYDSTSLAVPRILGDGRRLRTRVFNELQSHQLFADRFGRPDKGKVEGLVGYARHKFFGAGAACDELHRVERPSARVLPTSIERSAARSR